MVTRFITTRQVTRSTVILPIMTVKDLYERFHGKSAKRTTKPVMRTAKAINQNAANSRSKYSILARKSNAEASLFTIQKSITQVINK